MNPFAWFGQYILDPFLIHPFINILVGFMKVFEIVHIPWALGWAIIALTTLIRVALHPFFDQYLHTTRKMQELKPHLDALTKKHKKDPKKLQQEQLRLYKEAGINPASGCLFALVQMPIFIALYNTLSAFLVHGTGTNVVNQINSLLYFPFLKIQSIDPSFMMFNLALSPSKAGQWYYYLIPVITGILQYYQVQTTNPAAQSAVVAKTVEKDAPKKDQDDFQQAMQMQMKYIFPILIGWFSFSLPVGLSLYWNIFSIFSIMHYRASKAQLSTKKS